MAISGRITLSELAEKRVRVQKFKAFGDLLKEWRGDRDVEAVVRQVQHQGVEFDGATLRGWEYGWIGRPDPLRLLALARVLGRSTADVMNALSASRGIPVQRNRSDLPSHTGTGQSDSHHQGESDVPASNDSADREIRELRRQVEEYKAVLGHVENAASTLATALAVGDKIGTARKPQRKTRRRHRKAS